MRFKRFLIVPILLLLLHGFPCSVMGDEIPAPFAKAKEMALKAGIDPFTGLYSWKCEIAIDAIVILYKINYFPSGFYPYPEQINLRKMTDSSNKCISYGPEDKVFFKFTDKTGWVPAEEKEALEMGFQFFRELVKNNLI